MPKRPRLDNNDDDDKNDDACIERSGSNVYFYADVTVNNVRKMLGLLDAAKRVALRRDPSGDARVMLYIHSDGGDLYAGMTALDHIEASSVPVWTVCEGFVASAATVIALSGARRFAMPHATLLVHAPSTSIAGRFQEIMQETRNAQLVMRTLTRIYEKRTRLDRAGLERMMKKESLLTHEDALRAGFVEGAPPGVRCRREDRGPGRKPMAAGKRRQPGPDAKRVNTHIRFA
jgi:ATP-dependent protease ClpP protease subunit